MKNIVRLLAPIALLVPGACSLIADADRSKITDDDSNAAQGGSAATGEGGSGDSPSTGGSSGKGGGGSTAVGGTSGRGGGAGAGGEPDSGGMGGVPESGGTGGGDAGSGGEPDTAGTGGAGGESGMGGDCELELCGGACVDTSLDTAHCGACDRACSNVNTSALSCASGQCAPTCASGYGDCSEDDGAGVDDGCEVNFNDNATCGTTCENLVACEAGEFCVDGVCQAQCDAPNTECGDACVNLDTAIADCGACDRPCSATNTTGTDCAAGACDPTCSTGFEDCNVDDGTGPDDGCETDIAGSASNCNACGRACSNANATESACSSGACDPTCNAGFEDCNVDDGTGPDDGCETDIDASASNCNACGRSCSNANAAASVCSSGACDPTCNAGFEDCNVDDGTGPDDGCETNIAGSASNCNACGRVCSAANASASACSAGACDPTCNAGFDDCNVDDGSGTDDGCETNIAGSASNCNACGRACSTANASTSACSAGACVPSCDADFADCNVDEGSGTDDGCETDLAGDASNCNGCGRACSEANASDAACFAGTCDPSCDAGFADCSVDDGSGPDDGCETNVAASASNCNECGRVCSTANASASACSSGACAPACQAGFADCNADDGSGADDGCETDLDANTSCGTTCGNRVACTSGETCIAGACTALTTGVVKVAVPLAAGGQGQRYNLLHQGNPATPVNLAGTSLVIRAYAPNAINGNLSVFFLGDAESAKTLVPFGLMTAGFTDIEVPVPAAGAGFDPTVITVIRVEIETPEGNPGPWEQPATVVYFDSFTSLNGNLSDTFDTDPLPSLFDDSGVRPLAGSTQKYLATVP